MKLEVKMKYKKQTKGTYVYNEVSGGSPVPSLYVRKEAIDGDKPKTITLSLEY